MPTPVLLALLVGCVCAAAGQVLLKIGASGGRALADFLNLPLVVGFILYFAGAALWVFALSRERLVYVYPFTLLTFVLVGLGGVLILGEKIAPSGLVGMALIVLGILVLAFGSRGG